MQAKNRWAMKFGIHSGRGDEEAATYEICGPYLGDDIRGLIVGAEAPCFTLQVFTSIKQTIYLSKLSLSYVKSN